MGTDSGTQGRIMWARVKGRTENALLRMPFRSAYMFRPGLIVPLHGVKSATRLYRFFYTLLGPLFRTIEPLFPKYATTSEKLGRAMLNAAKHGAPKRVLDSADINRLAKAAER
jgi:hypothetical protein